MALRYSFDNGEEADRIEQAVEKTLARGIRTADLQQVEGAAPASTREMCDAVIGNLDATL